jgi:tetratricopeptide (TPR) repeat protein
MTVEAMLIDLIKGTKCDLNLKSSKKLNAKIQKNTHQDTLDELIEEQVEKIMREEDATNVKLLSKEARRIKIKQEIEESLKMREYSNTITSAVNILKTKGAKYLEAEVFQKLLEDLNKLGERISGLNLKSLDDETLDQVLTISPSSMDAILVVAILKFNEGLLPDSISVFTLLCTLDASEPDYWYRLGLVAQKNEQYDLSLNALAIATLLAPEFIGTRIYSAQCYIILQQYDDARAELEEAKKLINSINVEEEWSLRVQDIEILLAADCSEKEVTNESA